MEMGNGQGLGSAASQVVGLDLAKAVWPDMLKSGVEDTEEMEMPKNEIRRLHISERSAESPWGGPGDRAGIKAGRRRTKELPGGLETLRTTASLHHVGAMSPFPGYTAEVGRRGRQARAPSPAFVQLS